MDLIINNTFTIFAADLLAISNNQDKPRLLPLGEHLHPFQYNNIVELENAVLHIIMRTESPSDICDTMRRRGNTTPYIHNIAMSPSETSGKTKAGKTPTLTSAASTDEHQKATISNIIDSMIYIIYQTEINNRGLVTRYSYRLSQLMLAPFIFLNLLYKYLFHAQSGQSNEYTKLCNISRMHWSTLSFHK